MIVHAPRTLLVPAGLALAAGFLLFAVDPTTTGWFPPCPFYALTGWLCPLCGSTRAAHALLHGEFVRAFLLNPMTVGALLAAPLLGSRLPRLVFSLRGLGLMIAFGVIRNLGLFGPYGH